MAKAPIPQQRKDDFDYEIVRFDPGTLTFDVVYDGNPNTWARITLQEPLPTAPEELEALIHRFTPTVEMMEAREQAFDAGLVTGLIGQKRTMTRFSTREKERRDRERIEQERLKQAEEAAAAAIPPEPTPDALQVAEEEWIASIVEQTIQRMKQEGKL
jgi:hypothetical protein